MNQKHPFIWLAVIGLCAFFVCRIFAADAKGNVGYEYITIRWAGLDNTHVIRPGGQVEFVGSELKRLNKPDRADNRSFYLNAAMNGLTKEGYEFAGMANDDIIMKRALTR